MCLPSAQRERISYSTINIFLGFGTYRPELFKRGGREICLLISVEMAMPWTKLSASLLDKMQNSSLYLIPCMLRLL